MNEIGAVSAAAGATTTVLAAAASAALIIVLRPWLRRYALAMPDERSSHRDPTPQGGGIAVIAATIVAASVTVYFFAIGGGSTAAPLYAVFAGAVLMASIGAVDDIRPVAAGPRLLLQALIVAGVIYLLPDQLRIFPQLPLWSERFLLALGGLWFVNLVNFMDGIDWMTVAEVVPLTTTLALIGALGGLPPAAIVVSLALGGAMIGFAYFNRSIARLFLGDVGSLPIGLLVGWLLLLIATRGHLAAAIVMPLYYLADATITLLRRLIRSEPVWQAHRTHFYQIAIERGSTVTEVVARVFLVNIGLCALAVFTVIVPGRLSNVAALLGGAILVACLLFAFARGKRK
jgi:UDP-N-acetylmuramyl pentapeptide phosphotransferase/UDP-N-acetylglucosamine-1-phosphate transferase